MASSAAEVRAVLRGLLRAVDRNLTRVSGNTMWRREVLAQWRQAAAAGGGAGDGVEAQLALARDWSTLITNIASHKALLVSYNIGRDPDERTKHMVEATARRVGFSMPKPMHEGADPR